MMNLSYGQIDRKDLGSLWASIDWENDRQLYLSSKDLSVMLATPIEDIINNCSEGSYTDTYSITFVKIQNVLTMLKKTPDKSNYNKVIYWLEQDILPSIKALIYGTFIKL